MEQTKYDVFISYSRKDIATARDIFKALSGAGISCFLDEKIDTPDVWNKLVNSIENCKLFLYLGSENTAAARITPKELTYAVNHKDKSFIYPYFIDDSKLPKVHEFLLADINWRRKSSHPIDTGLIPDIQSILRNKPPLPLLKKVLTEDVLQITVCGEVFEMVRVEGGSLELGATKEQLSDANGNEHPAHNITLPTYYIGRYPVTQNIWEIVMGYNKSHYAKKEGLLSKVLMLHNEDLRLDEIKESVNQVMNKPIGEAAIGLGKFAFDKTKSWIKQKVEDQVLQKVDDRGHYPAERLSHDEALEFVRRLSQMTNIHFSLPTEEEWEYAARGGQKSQGYKYAGSNDINEVAWYQENSDVSTHPVGEKKPNELGLYDMSGNVWEWTATPAHSYETESIPGGNVFIRRGGSWWHEAKNCRVSRRYASDHSKKTSGLGLRVVIRKNVEQKNSKT